MDDAAFNAERRQLLRVFAAKVRELRKHAELSQEEFAEHANLHRTSVGYFEQARREPNLSTLLILADALHVSLDTLVQGVPVPQQRRPARQSKRSSA